MNGPRFERPAPDAEEARAALVTVRDLVRWAATRMTHAGCAFGHGTANAWDEAAWLVLWSLRLPPDALEPVFDARLAPSEREAAIALVERRCVERLPAAYLTGEAWLRGVRFLADPRALVPRSPIAELLDGGALEPWLGEREPGAVLDLCCGGGSLAILAALRFPDARVVGADLSADALALATENLALHGLGRRVRLARGDLWHAVADDAFDLVVCNPPYVNAHSMASLPAEYRHEPQAALGGVGADGMELVRRIVAGARGHLADGGLLVVEIGHEAGHFEAAFPGLAFTWVPTEAGEDRIALVERDALP
jgi:ribosomal protein L3 glutamine methyltransferase